MHYVISHHCSELCVPTACSTAWSLVMEQSTFVDWQKAKVQENPDEVRLLLHRGGGRKGAKEVHILAPSVRQRALVWQLNAPFMARGRGHCLRCACLLLLPLCRCLRVRCLAQWR